ncbi:hypothetical protein [Actinokineospora sp.]|uniref:hypothetical protein n=1 Tax=Actinokineospora sp. TaxID=1872133 RepID=UPI004037A280
MVLYIVLLLVLSAFALLVTALTTAETLWAWLSVAVSVLAAGILVVDWLRTRRRKAAADPVDEAEFDDDPVESEVPVAPDPDPADTDDEDFAADPADEPDEESTDAADLLVVTSLTVDVRVVDERPRYHLTTCAWLAGRPSIALPVAEARELGFTPCGQCAPDATLAARHRAARGVRHGPKSGVDH